MNPFNKYEAVGIFFSVAVMALALSVIRFKTDVFATQGGEAPAAAAITASIPKEGEDLEGALRGAFSASGELIEMVVDDVRLGIGKEVGKGDTLTVHYIGTTQDGVRFDSSYERGEPFVFTVGAGKVIQGWEEGLIGMKVGGQRILVIPPRMAYGNMQVGAIPPDSPLVFAVELLKIE